MHSNNSAQKIILNYTIALIPLILYGFYRNGIIVYQNYETSLFQLFKPIILPAFSFFLGFLADKYYFHHDSSESFTPLLMTISAMLMPPTVNTILYLILSSITIIISKFISTKINLALFNKLLVIIAILFLSNYTYLNQYESSISMHYNVIDLLFGRSSGGLAVTSSLLCLISYIYLMSTSIYKKIIPPIIICTYLILNIFLLPILSFHQLFNNFLNSTILFASIFIATLPIYSPITLKEQITYSIIIGITSFILINFLSVYEGIYIILLITPLINKIVSKIAPKLILKKR